MPRPIPATFLGVLVLAASGLALPAARAAAGPPLEPAAYLALKLRADAAWSARDAETAVSLYEQLLAANPADGDSRFRLALGLYRAGRADEARAHLLRCHEEGFDNPSRTALAMAEAAAEAGDRESAYRWLEEALPAPLENRPDLKTNDSFAALRDDPRFRELAGFLPDGAMTREEGWRYDLGFFLAEARRMHAHPDRRAFDPEFARAVESLQARVGSLDDVAVAMEVTRLVVRYLGDGHSVLYPMSTERVTFPGFLPVRFYSFADGMFVVAARPGHEDLVGARLVAVEGHPAGEVLEKLAALVSRDNAQGMNWMGPLYMTSPAALRAIGVAPSLERVALTVADAAGTREVTLEPTAEFDFDTRVPPAPGQDPPRWLARVNENLWWEPLAGTPIQYVQFNTVRDPATGPPLRGQVDSLRAEMAERGTRLLVLDVRHNNGGNGHLVWPLVRLVAWHEMRAPGNRTFVITGRNTFSACQNLVNHLERATSAVFVGEISSSRPNFAGEDTSVELPWSGLRLSISTRWWQDSEPGDIRPYVPVSMPVALTSEDWRAGRDPVLDALVEYARLEE